MDKIDEYPFINELYSKTPESFINRGVIYFKSGYVLDLVINTKGPLKHINGKVSNNSLVKIYSPYLKISHDNEHCEGYYCDCMAFSQYNVPCKHILAIGLKYTDKLNSENKMNYNYLGLYLHDIFDNDLINLKILIDVDQERDTFEYKLFFADGLNSSLINSPYNMLKKLVSNGVYSCKKLKRDIRITDFDFESTSLINKLIDMYTYTTSVCSYNDYYSKSPFEYLMIPKFLNDNAILIKENNSINEYFPLKNYVPFFFIDSYGSHKFKSSVNYYEQSEDLFLTINNNSFYSFSNDNKLRSALSTYIKDIQFDTNKENLYFAYIFLKKYNLVDANIDYENSMNYLLESVKCEIYIDYEIVDDDIRGLLSYRFADNITGDILNVNEYKIKVQLKQLGIYIFDNNKYHFESNSLFYKHMDSDFISLREIGHIVYSNKLQKLINSNSKIFDFNVAVIDELIDMNVTSIYDESELREIFKQMEQKTKKIYITHNNNVINLDCIRDDKSVQKLYSLGIDYKSTNTNIKLRSYYAFYLNDDLVNKDDSFNSFIDDVNNIKNKEYTLPSVTAILRDYQVDGFKYLLANYELGFGTILADDMGLGKTLQIITFLSKIYEDNTKLPSIIIVPKSLLYNWENEFIKFNKELKFTLIKGNKFEREYIIKNNKNKIILTTYDQFKRDYSLYIDYTYELVVIDEAQVIKNQKSNISKAIKSINCKNSIALTGTPIENRLSELHSIFDFVMPGYLQNYAHFKKRFENPIVKDNNPIMLNSLLTLVNPFIIRRTKKEVLNDLPDKLENNLMCEMTKEQEKVYMSYYMQIKEDFDNLATYGITKNKFKILALLTRLRQICNHPLLVNENYSKDSGKLDACLELVDNAIEAEHRILLFSQFTGMLDILERELISKNIKYLRIDGQTKLENRQTMVDMFNADNSIKVFLISLKAGGYGLNLTGADMVIHYDPWWNPAIMAQASDRAHRIGQEKVVQVYHLVTHNTIEEKIIELQNKKQNLLNAILENESSSITQLDEEEIKKLFER